MSLNLSLNVSGLFLYALVVVDSHVLQPYHQNDKGIGSIWNASQVDLEHTADRKAGND
jgi:hypothetical protein